MGPYRPSIRGKGELMTQKLGTQHWDVLVVGGGSAGIAAAASAARNGARTLLVDAGPMIGGELLSGIPIDGCLNTRGEWVVGGFLRELLHECDRLGGYVGHMFDWRTIWVVCCDPEIMKMLLTRLCAALPSRSAAGCPAQPVQAHRGSQAPRGHLRYCRHGRCCQHPGCQPAGLARDAQRQLRLAMPPARLQATLILAPARACA